MKTRILIVDDEPYVARTLARLLENKGFQTTAVHSYDEVVEALDCSPFDLAIIDYVMPGTGGGELARYVQQHFPEMGTIINSGMPDFDLFRDGFGAADRSRAATNIRAERPSGKQPTTLVRQTSVHA